MGFIDVGCNIGVFTIIGAKLGRKVIAVDAFKPNLERVAMSLDFIKTPVDVTLVWNALSNKSAYVHIQEAEHNIGGNFIRTENSSPQSKSIGDALAVTMDDLVSLIDTTVSYFMKMDIEGFEERAMSKAVEFFKHVDVRIILMEWLLVKMDDRSERLARTMTNLSYSPREDGNIDRVLSLDNVRQWPNDIVWVRT